jgi:hypothetical protein
VTIVFIMMVFILHSFENCRSAWLRVGTWLHRFSLLLLCCWSAWSYAQAPANEPVQVKTFQLERSADGIYVSAQLQLELTPTVEDALLKGIPMFFVAQSDLMQARWYWYDRELASVQRTMRLSYHPLTRRWRLSVAQGTAQETHQTQAIGQQFETLDEALAAMRRISRWRVADAVPHDSDARLDVVFSFQLDLNKLPRPFQLGNVGLSDWTIATRAKATVPAEITP